MKRIIIVTYLVMVVCGYGRAADFPALPIHGNPPAGFTASIVQDGRIMFNQSIGYANIGLKRFMSDTTVMNMASMTKQFTAAAIFMLEEEGKLRTTDSIQKYIPELPNYGKTITIEQLLHHSSGIGDHLELLALQNNFRRERLQWNYTLNFLQQHPVLLFDPGKGFAYSNTGYMLLAEVVYRTSGKTLGGYLDANVFQPLHLNSFKILQEEVEEQIGYTASYVLRGKFYHKIKHPQGSALGATGLFGSTSDMMKWFAFLMQEYKHPNRRWVLRLFQQPEAEHNRYGGGLILKPFHGYSSFEHSGGWNEYLIQCRCIPDLNCIVLAACNTTALDPFVWVDQACEALMRWSPKEVLPQPLPTFPFTGNYVSREGVFRKITQQQDTLRIEKYVQGKEIITSLAYIPSNLRDDFLFEDEEGDTCHVFKATDGNWCFRWIGGHYFQFEREYRQLINSMNWEENASGHFYNKRYHQHVHIKHKKNHWVLVYSPWFRYKLQDQGGGYFRIPKERIHLHVEQGQWFMGNDWVFGIPFLKEK